MNTVVMLTVGVVFLGAPLVFAQDASKPAAAKVEAAKAEAKAVADQPAGAVAQAEVKLVEIGNKICPVSGEKVKEKEMVKYTYNGKVYNMCCGMCKKDFDKNPAKYAKIAEDEIAKTAAESVAKPAETKPVEPMKGM